MTRSDINSRSWQARKKNMKRDADHLQIGKRAAIDLIIKVEADHRKNVSSSGISRRNPGRMDGVQWNGDSFVCKSHVDDESEWRNHSHDSSEHENWEEDYDLNETPEERDFVVSLADIAKPMKIRGLAKDYEIVASCSRVITWEDYGDYIPDKSGDGWEQWEDLFDDEQKSLRRSYAEVLVQSSRETQ